MNLKRLFHVTPSQPIKATFSMILVIGIFRKVKTTVTPPHTQNTKATVIFGQKGLPTKGHEGTFWVNGNIQYHDCGERSTTV